MNKTLEQTLRELGEAKRNLYQAFLDTGLGKFMVWCVDGLSNLLRKIGIWFMCKIGQPIFSPSRAQWDGELRCLWCGKVHGDLLKGRKR